MPEPQPRHRFFTSPLGDSSHVSPRQHIPPGQADLQPARVSKYASLKQGLGGADGGTDVADEVVVVAVVEEERVDGGTDVADEVVVVVMVEEERVGGKLSGPDGPTGTAAVGTGPVVVLSRAARHAG